MEMAVVNVTELLVESALKDAYIAKGRLTCDCARCVDDIQAIALNHLQPHYVSTDRGVAYVKAQYIDQQLQSDVLRELAFAAQTVSSSPRHVHGS